MRSFLDLRGGSMRLSVGAASRGRTPIMYGIGHSLPWRAAYAEPQNCHNAPACSVWPFPSSQKVARDRRSEMLRRPSHLDQDGLLRQVIYHGCGKTSRPRRFGDRCLADKGGCQQKSHRLIAGRFSATVEKCYHLLTILGFVNCLRPAIAWEWP
jgi:hypothetical protein